MEGKIKPQDLASLVREAEVIANEAQIRQLYAGLAVLARDMHQYMPKYLEKHKDEGDAAARFEEVVFLAQQDDVEKIGIDKRDMAFPKYAGLRVEVLPKDLAEAAATGKPTVAPLGSSHVVHEWTTYPGEYLFARFREKFGPKFKEVVCGKDGFYEQLNKGLLGQDTLPAAIAGQVLLGFSPATFWYPLALYVGLLLVKTGLKTYCEAGDLPRQAEGRP